MAITAGAANQLRRSPLSLLEQRGRPALLPASNTIMVSVTVPKRPSTFHNAQSAHRRGIPRAAPLVLGGVALMHIIYRILYVGYENPTIASWLAIPAASSDYCLAQGSNEKCGRPDLFAFQCISAMAFWTCGSLSFYHWHVTGLARQTRLMASPDSRIYSGLPVTETIVAVNLTYQIWDFLVSLTIPEHCTLIMMTHHAIAAFVCWNVLASQMLGYYALFFLGMSEVSSMFLVLLDMSKYFAPAPNTLAHLVVETVTGPLFVVAFIYYRVVLWWRVTFQFSQDVQHVVSTGTAERLRPGQTWTLYLLLILTVPMGVLQLYWLTLIGKEVQATLTKEEMA
jgi:hypothetical protein